MSDPITRVLHGDIDIAAAELALRLSRGDARRLDLRGVTRVHPVAERLLDATGLRS